MNSNHIGGKETIVLSVQDYPELKGLAAGTEVSGTWRGSVSTSNHGSVTIQYDEFLVEEKGNPADKEMERMRGVKPEPIEEHEDYIDY